MNFHDFRNTFHAQKVFSTGDIAKEWADFNYVNLINWQKKGYLLKLRNTWYAFPDTLRSEADLFFLSNRLRSPSYLSLQSALRYYDMIPESVFSVTAVTTAKPVEWHTGLGHFSYRSLKPSLFFGFQTLENQGVSFNIADPEKTLLDLLYFHPNLAEVPDFEGLRLNREEVADRIAVSRLEDYLTIIGSKALETRWRSLQKYLQQ